MITARLANTEYPVESCQEIGAEGKSNGLVAIEMDDLLPELPQFHNRLISGLYVVVPLVSILWLMKWLYVTHVMSSVFIVTIAIIAVLFIKFCRDMKDDMDGY